ncbi:putative tymovirus 45/protein [Dictyocaulus viviparus]|uniref:Putative tymovirus 45/protein n=1 Tax=Dictyocaulus viviparus TaxID=29172 RepID=A0A0D8XBY7_DICVI|nr:putative tymovirus 45/protein [Dictyocaulus viviparus]
MPEVLILWAGYPIEKYSSGYKSFIPMYQLITMKLQAAMEELKLYKKLLLKQIVLIFNVTAVASRLPGRCLPGDFDCGFGRCIPINLFHDGKPDCYDGSDEWCFFGQIKCGAYCVDMSNAFGCLFSSKCDESNRQPTWCSVSKEKICGEPIAFPCKGYGECVLWPWLLDGKKHCIDGSDEDQFYVKTLEASFRCLYNRTKQVTGLPPLNYTDSFLKFNNPTILSGIRQPQYPSLFSPPPSLLSPSNLYFTPFPSFNLPPPVHLSKVTGLPPLPPPFPTLLPSDSIAPVKQPISMGISPTKDTIFVPNSLTAPDYPFDYSFLQQTTSPTPKNLNSPGSPISVHQNSQSINSATSPTNHLSHQSTYTGENEKLDTILTKHVIGHIRGRVKSTTLPSTKLTHIKVVATGNEADSLRGEKETLGNPFEEEISGKNYEASNNNEKVTPFSTNSLNIKENAKEIPKTEQSTTPLTIDWTFQVPEEQLVPLPDYHGAINPKFQTTERSLIDSSVQQTHMNGLPPEDLENQVQITLSSGSKIGKPEDRDNDLLGLDITTSRIMPSTQEANNIESTNENTCLTDLINTSRNRYPYLECQCPIGEMLMDEHCETRENDMAFYSIHIDSVCGKSHLTSEEKKWIVIGKVGETVTVPTCVRMSPNGEAIVNSLCYPECNLSNIQQLMTEQPNSKRSIIVKEAALCDYSTTNFCHLNAVCDVEDVRLKCVCKLGTNDTSNGLGKICEGAPVDECIMILGICLLFWLIILLGLLMLFLLAFLLLRCCPHCGNSVHPEKEGFGFLAKGKGKDNAKEENKHIAAIMSALLAKTAGGQREMAMKMALTEMELKKERRKEKSVKMMRSSENHNKTLAPVAITNQHFPTFNGKLSAMTEIESIPGTVHASSNETPILEKINPPDATVEAIATNSTATVIEKLSPQQTSKITNSTSISSGPLPLSAVLSNPISVNHETSAVSPLTPSAAVTPPPPTPPISQTATHIVNGETSTSEPQFTCTTIPADVENRVHRNFQRYQHHGYERQETSSSLEALIQSRYSSENIVPVNTLESHNQKDDQSEVEANISHAARAGHEIGSGTTMSGTSHSVPTFDRLDSNAKLSDMLGVTLVQSGTLTSSKPSESLLQSESDKRVVEEISRNETDFASSDKDLPESSHDGKTIGSTSEVNLLSEQDTSDTCPSIKPDVDIIDPSKIKHGRTGVSSRPTTITNDSDKLRYSRGRFPSRSSISPATTDDKPKHDRRQFSYRDSATSNDSGKSKRLSDRPSSRATASANTPDKEKATLLRVKRLPLPPSTISSRSKASPRSQVSSKPTPSIGTLENVKHSKDPIMQAIGSTKNAPMKARKSKTDGRTETQRATSRGAKYRGLLNPPDNEIPGSTDESDPEIATFKRLAETAKRKEPIFASRRLPRRPKRQLSSISEKSAEIAAEAVLQNQRQDYSVSAPNTTRSVTKWNRYLPSDTLGDISDQTDVDISSDYQNKSPTSKLSDGSSSLTKKPVPYSRTLWKPNEQSRRLMEIRREGQPMPIEIPPITNVSAKMKFRPKFTQRSDIITSPEIPDVTLRRSLDRLNLIERSPLDSPQRGAFTSRSYICPRKELSGRASETGAVQAISNATTSKESSDIPKVDHEKLSKTSRNLELPQSSRSAHHALISRKIATRRHETHVARSTSDLSTISRSDNLISQNNLICRSDDNLYGRSSSFRADDKMRFESSHPGGTTTTHYYRKCRSVVNSPINSLYRTSSKFSIRSLPIRSGSTIEFSPYFTPQADFDKPPKEDLWWKTAQRPSDFSFK